jgi:dTDP-4-amino-4,6-dideoxygalactose transaminase
MPKTDKKEKLAIFGGKPVISKRPPQPSPIGEEEIAAANQVLKTGVLSWSRRGDYVAFFEKSFARFLGSKYAVSASSGTAALHTAVSALEIGPEDEVLVPALTFVSSASVVLQVGAKPVFVDIDERTFNLDVSNLEKKVTKKTKAIIVVHLYGNPCDMTKIKELADRYDLKVIEDCSQAHGAEYNNSFVGTFGNMACFSFQQTKNMTCGEGGMVITDDAELYKKCSNIVDHGLIGGDLEKYDYDHLGYNYHLTDLQAAIATEQLKKLSNMNKKRIENSSLYKKHLSGTDLSFQKETQNAKNVYYTLTVLLPEQLKNKRDWFVEAVRAENAEVLKLYPLSLPQTKLFSGSKADTKYPIASSVASRLFNLCTNPGISQEIIRKTCRAIKKVLVHLNAK